MMENAFVLIEMSKLINLRKLCNNIRTITFWISLCNPLKSYIDLSIPIKIAVKANLRWIMFDR